MNTPHSLTRADIDKLADFLLSDRTPEECMDICTLDGFFTCLAIGPETIPPSQWLPVVLGETEDDEMVWDSTEEANRILGFLMGYFNGIVQVFQDDPASFESMVYQNPESDPILEEWCYGFMMGVHLNPKLWEQLLDSPGQETLLGPIFLQGTENGWDMLELEKFKDVTQEEWLDLVIDSVVRIHDYWLFEVSFPSTGVNFPVWFTGDA